MEKFTFFFASRKTDTKVKVIDLFFTYHPFLKDFASDISKHLYILYLDKKVKKKSLPLVPWFHSEGQENWEATLLGLNCTP